MKTDIGEFIGALFIIIVGFSVVSVLSKQLDIEYGSLFLGAFVFLAIVLFIKEIMK